jgi:Rrf2 family protein
LRFDCGRTVAKLVAICETARVANPTNTQFAVAVHVLTLLASTPERTLSSSDMAASANANPVYVRRVLGPLREAGMVASRPGVNGGWQLSLPPAEITLGDVWRAIQGADPILGLHGANPDCEVGQTVHRHLGAIDRRVAAAAEAELDRTSVLDLIPAVSPPASR